MGFPVTLSLQHLEAALWDEMSDVSGSDDEFSASSSDFMDEWEEQVEHDYPMTDIFGRVVGFGEHTDFVWAISNPSSDHDKIDATCLGVSLGCVHLAASHLVSDEQGKDSDANFLDQELSVQRTGGEDYLPGSVDGLPRPISPPEGWLKSPLFHSTEGPFDSVFDYIHQPLFPASLTPCKQDEECVSSSLRKDAGCAPSSVGVTPYFSPYEEFLVHDVGHHEREDLAIWAVRECLYGS